jgi:AraC-like DNA-binding protein
MHHIKGLLMILADLIVSRDMLVPQAEDPLDSLIAHMRQNVEKTLSLDDAARFVNKSKSRLSHMFTERLGKSFKQVQTEIRMEWAERLLVKQVSTSIQDIALMIGFQDPLYFTKYFKRYKGLSPTEFRESLERAQQPSPAPDAGPKAEA